MAAEKFLSKATASDASNLPGLGGLFTPINSNLYHYAGNNPVRYVDPNGCWSDEMEKAVNDHLSEAYERGTNDCDVWVQKVEQAAHPDSTLKTDWGEASETNAKGHQDKLKDSLSENMSLGTNVVLQTPKGYTDPIHAMIACLNNDGTVDVAECTRNPEDKSLLGTMPGGYSEKFSYKSESEFKDSGWGTLQFYSLGDGNDYLPKETAPAQNQAAKPAKQNPVEKLMERYYEHH